MHQKETNVLVVTSFQGAQSRKLKHCHYVGWPDMYVPEKKSLIAFVRLIRESINTSGSKGPVVVHCRSVHPSSSSFLNLNFMEWSECTTILLYVCNDHL